MVLEAWKRSKPTHQTQEIIVGGIIVWMEKKKMAKDEDDDMEEENEASDEDQESKESGKEVCEAENGTGEAEVLEKTELNLKDMDENDLIEWPNMFSGICLIDIFDKSKLFNSTTPLYKNNGIWVISWLKKLIIASFNKFDFS